MAYHVHELIGEMHNTITLSKSRAFEVTPIQYLNLVRYISFCGKGPPHVELPSHPSPPLHQPIWEAQSRATDSRNGSQH